MFDVSIVIAAYNADKTLKKTLESIIDNVADINYEIVFVNDGSTDNTAKIIRKYAEKHSFIRVFNQENKGVGKAKNKGLKETSGRYIWVVDADDLIPKNAFAAFNSDNLNQGTDILIFDYERLEAKTSLPVPMVGIDADIYATLPEKEFTLKEYPNLLISSHFAWNKLYRREFLQENNIFFSEEQAHVDIIMHVKTLFAAKKIRKLKGSILKYCEGNSFISNTKDERRLGALKGFEESEEFLKVYFPLSVELKTAWQVFKANHMVWVYHNSPESLKERMREYNDNFLMSFSKKEVFSFVQNPYLRGDVMQHTLQLHNINEKWAFKLISLSNKYPFLGKIFGIR